ncbi:hypothetical protein NQV05_02150 [Mycoplasmopsis agalactiae]|uniref:hypothetical protein n=1 Tax=Mycoplasmopsis agalactiae TaxID=2110 RepID=UPI00211C67A4|nr:hypothetical protein [Mycoplasmopsis agalactiae]UUM25185.1 hypothetical protein NQV05_02150 [Mycoplasmopsis agalactiae]
MQTRFTDEDLDIFWIKYEENLGYYPAEIDFTEEFNNYLKRNFSDKDARYYVQIVKQILSNVDKLDAYRFEVYNFTFAVIDVLNDKKLTITELEKLLSLTQIALTADNEVFMEEFNNFASGADYINFLIDNEIETVNSLIYRIQEHDEYDSLVDWELYDEYEDENKKEELPWLAISNKELDLVYVGASRNPYDWELVDEREWALSYLDNHLNKVLIVDWIKAKELVEQDEEDKQENDEEVLVM